jgi:hypothetical protein
MGFFRRAKATFDIAKSGIEIEREQQHNRPKTTAEMTAQMEATISHGEAVAQRAQRTMRLAKIGVDTLAELKSVALDQRPTYLQANIVWTVKPVGAPPYETRSADAVQPALASSLVPGAQCTVKVDPDDPQSVMLINYGPGWTPPAPPPPGQTPPSVPAPGSAATTVERVSKLAELHAQGLITDDEFATRKAAILGS